jgi:hypothetical protein
MTYGELGNVVFVKSNRDGAELVDEDSVVLGSLGGFVVLMNDPNSESANQ